MATKEVYIGSIGPLLFEGDDFDALETDGTIDTGGQDADSYSVAGTQVVGAQQAAVADPSAATSNDLALANTADATYGGDFTSIQTEVNALRTEVEDLRTQLTAALTALRAHGLIAT